MAALIKNGTGKTWGVAVESIGLSAEDYKQKADSDIFRHKNEVGEEVTKVFYNFKSAGTITGVTTASTDEAVGASLTLANEVSGLGGVSGGTTLIHSVELTRQSEQLQKVTLEFERHPTLTVA
jgi:hypothetical protein